MQTKKTQKVQNSFKWIIKKWEISKINEKPVKKNAWCIYTF